LRKHQLPTKVLLQAGHDVVIFGCGSLSASVPAGQASLGFCLLSFTFVFQSAAVPGLTIFKSPNIAKP